LRIAVIFFFLSPTRFAAQTPISTKQPTPLLLLKQHAPTYTIGKRGRTSDFHTIISDLITSGAEIAETSRGGETTYHGPGQLVAYPIVSLRGLRLGARAYVEALEDAMITTAGRYGIAARGRIPGRTGVWVGDAKLGAVGVAISSGFTRHGLALNVCTDLSPFSDITPCGDRQRKPTSLQAELGGKGPRLTEAAEVLADAVAAYLGFEGVEWMPDVRWMADKWELLCAGNTPQCNP
jgi:lipoyl(octanoyl) transferase 2